MNLATAKLFQDYKNGHLDEFHELLRNPWHCAFHDLLLQASFRHTLKLSDLDQFRNSSAASAVQKHSRSFKKCVVACTHEGRNPYNFNDSLHDLRNGHIDDLLQDSSRLTLCRRHLDHFKTLLLVNGNLIHDSLMAARMKHTLNRLHDVFRNPWHRHLDVLLHDLR